MAAPAAANGKITLATLACNARRLADEMERLHSEFERTGALLRIQRFMELHSEGNPQFDMLDAAKGGKLAVGRDCRLDSPSQRALICRMMRSALAIAY